MAIYEVVDSVVRADIQQHNCRSYFRGDSMEFRNTLYERMDFNIEETANTEDTEDIQIQLPVIEEPIVYSPFKVCYVNSYRVFDINSTMFDYSRETEYDTLDYETLLGECFNKMYVVFDDIHMVFSIKNQQCVKYPFVIDA